MIGAGRRQLDSGYDGRVTVTVYLFSADPDKLDPLDRLMALGPSGIVCYFSAITLHGLYTQRAVHRHVATTAPRALRRNPAGTEYPSTSFPPPRGTRRATIRGTPYYSNERTAQLVTGVQRRLISERLIVRCTMVAQTLIDGLLRPYSSGGNAVVMEAWENAPELTTPATLVELARQIGYPPLSRRVGYMITSLPAPSWKIAASDLSTLDPKGESAAAIPLFPALRRHRAGHPLARSGAVTVGPDEQDDWKDEALDFVLVAMAGSFLRREWLVFRCARMLYRHLGVPRRQSLHLDAVRRGEVPGQVAPTMEQIRHAIETAIRTAAEAGDPVDYALERMNIKRASPTQHPRGWDGCCAELRLRIALKLRAFLESTPDHRRKLRLLKRKPLRVKDLADLGRISDVYGTSNDAFWIKVGSEFRIACADRIVDCAGWSSFASVEADAARAFTLDPTLSATGDVNATWGKVRQVVGRLDQLGIFPVRHRGEPTG